MGRGRVKLTQEMLGQRWLMKGPIYKFVRKGEEELEWIPTGIFNIEKIRRSKVPGGDPLRRK